jgi:phosphoribosyl-AMP cyclohydrolase
MNRKNISGSVDSQRLEQGSELMIDFEKLKKIANCGEPVVPVAVQDVSSGEVLIIAYANETALQYTLEHKEAAFWSTSRNELWVKGKTSGDVLTVVDVFVNCEQNSLLYKVKMVGKGSCHVKDESGATRFGCFYRVVKNKALAFVKK